MRTLYADGTLYAMDEILWTRTDRSTRGPQPTLTHEQIAATAIAIADREGLDAVSMRRIAGELGCGTMSLYRYVATKDELHDLMRDAVAGEDDPGSIKPTGHWRADLRTAAHQMRATALRHPWLPAVIVGRPSFGPNEVQGAELILTVLSELGLSADETLGALGLIGSFVRGYVQQELAERQWRRPAKTPEERAWQKGMIGYLARLEASGRYPNFTKVRAGADTSPDPDLVFDWQLDRVLDGLESVLPKRRRTSRLGR
jgi:AcrR family transcriptional regulator